MRHTYGRWANDIGHTNASCVCVEFVRSGCVERDESLPGVEDEGVIYRGLSVLADGKEGERDGPVLALFYQRQAIVGIEGRTRWFDYPSPRQVQTRGIYLGERGFHPRLQ